MTSCEQLINGPWLRHRFLGASVQNWSVSSALNQESTSVTVQLIEDCGTYSGVEYIADPANPRPELVGTEDGFCKPPPGTPVIFRLAESTLAGTPDADKGFEYAGIVQNWNIQNDANGLAVISVQLTDPSFILDQIQVVCSDLAERMDSDLNVLNVFGSVHAAASVGGFSACASSPAGGLNPAVGPNGILWSDLKDFLMYLTADSAPAGKQALNFGNPGGRIIYQIGKFDGDIGPTDDCLAVDDQKVEYLLDLHQMPIMPADYRLSLTTGSVLDIISEVCTDAGHDFWCELVPVVFGGEIKNIIKVRTIDRKIKAAEEQIRNFRDQKNALYPDYDGGIVISVNSGVENSTNPTAHYLYGAHKLSGVVEDRNFMIPFFGYDTGGLMNQVVTSPQLAVALDTTKLNESLNTTIFTPLTVGEAELQAALSDFDSWSMVSHAVGGQVSTYLDNINQLNRVDFGSLNSGLQGKVPSWDAFVPDESSSENRINDLSAEDANKVYEFVKNYADTYYGKQYYMDVSTNNNICKSTAFSITNGYLYDFDITNEGFFQNEADAFVGGSFGKKTLDLANNSYLSDIFKDDLGKFGTIVQFDLSGAASIDGNKLNLIPNPTRMDDSEYVTDGNHLFVRAEVSDAWVSGSPKVPADPFAFGAIIKLAAPIFAKEPPSGYLNGFAGNAIVFGELSDTVPENINIIDRGSFVHGAANVAVSPEKAVVPVRSNHETYGPWYTSTAGDVGSPVRGTLVEQDDSLAPWEFGITAFMNSAAQTMVEDTKNGNVLSERGSITFAGIPQTTPNSELMHDLDGDEKRFLASRSPILLGALDATYLTDMTAIVIALDLFEGALGPAISNMSVNFGPDGFTTQYQFNTYSQQYGKFARLNADRLKRQGRIKFKQNRAIRSQLQSSFVKNFNKNYSESFISKTARTPKSAHHCLVGRYVEGDRLEMNSQAIKEANVIFSSGQYENAAIMSWDGIFTPVSRNATLGGLPGFVKASGAVLSDEGCLDANKTRGTDPPTANNTGIGITVNYLDPVSNVSGPLVSDSRSNSSISGHKFEILGRNSTLPNDGWSLQKEGVAEASDYRFMALRGPLMLQAWGYDTQGKPVPNSIDDVDAARSGNFAISGTTNKFMKDWLTQPKSWPVAPVDLRLDKERGVWTIPTSRTDIHVNALNCISTGTGTPNSVSGLNMFYASDTDGNDVTDTTLQAYWPWDGVSPPSGMGRTPVYYDENDCKYYFYPTNRLDFIAPSGGSPTRFKDIKTIELGSGFDFTASEHYDPSCPSKITLHITPSSGSGSIPTELCYTGLASCGESTDYYKYEDTSGCLGFGTGLLITLDPSNPLLSRVDTNFAAIGTQYASNGCEWTADGGITSNFTSLNFVGNLHVQSGTDCQVTVSGFQQPLLLGEADVCQRVTGPDFYAKKIVTGSGLEFEQNSCTGILHSVMSAQGSTYTRGAGCDAYNATAFNAKRFEKIQTLAGLSLTYNDATCTLQLSGVEEGRAIVANQAVCGRVAGPENLATAIYSTTGLEFTYYDQPNCKVQLSSTIKASGLQYTRNSYGVGTGCPATWDETSQETIGLFELLKFKNMDVRRDGCEITVSGIGQPLVMVSQSGSCLASGTNPNDINATKHIVAGTGLEFVTDSSDKCRTILNSTQTIRGATWQRPIYNPESGCSNFEPSAVVPATLYEALIFTGNLSTTFENCTGIISGIKPLIEVVDSGLCSGVGFTTAYTVDRIIFGSGTRLEENYDATTDKCGIEVHTSPFITGVNYVLRPSYPYDECGNVYDASGQVGGFFNSLTVAGNIALQDLGGCGYQLSGFNNASRIKGHTWVKSAECDPYFPSIPLPVSPVEGLIFTGYLSADLDGCSGVISGITPQFDIYDSGLCGGTGITSLYSTKTLIMGSGVETVQKLDGDTGECLIEIHTAPRIEGNTYIPSYPYNVCGNNYENQTGVNGRFNTLKTAGNISLRDLGGCEYEISGFQNTTRIKGATWISGELCNPHTPDTPFNSSPIEGLIFTGYLSAEINGCSGIISGVTPEINVWSSGLCSGVGATSLYTTRTIIFGSGLETIQQTDGDTGECLIQVHNGITAEGVTVASERCSGVQNWEIGYQDPVKFSNLKVLGTGISASYDPTNCEFTISGYADGYSSLTQKSGSFCDGEPTRPAIKVSELQIATGLKIDFYDVTSGPYEGECFAELGLSIALSGNEFDNICDSPYLAYKGIQPAPPAAVINTKENNWRELNFIGNLSTTVDPSGCAVTVSGAPGVLVSGMPACGDGAVSLFAAEQITVGTGLTVQSDGCKAIISSALTIGGTTRETGNFCSTLSSFSQESVENIVFQDFLTAAYDSDTCTVYVSGAPTINFGGSGVCGRSAVAPTQAQTLTVGTGLAVQAGNDCEVLLQSSLEIAGTDRRLGASDAVPSHKYEKLSFIGPNVSIHRSGCETIISGVDIDKTPSGEGLAACGRGAVAAFDVYNTQYGTGLEITNAGGEIAIIHSAMRAEGTDRRGGGSSAVGPHRYETLNFVGPNLSVYKDGCDTIISGVDIDKTPSGEGLAACGRGAVAPFDVYNTQYGTGIEITNAGGDIATIQSALEVLGTDRRGGGASAVASHKYETLEFVGSGLSIHQDSNCKTIISGALDIDPVEGAAVCGRSAVPEFNSTKLLFGSGIQVVNNSDVAEISSAQKIQGTDRSGGGSTAVDSQVFENLTFGDNLSLSEDGSNCGLTLSGVPAVKVSGIANCGSSALSTVIANQLDFGSGLTTTATADGVQVDVAIEAGGTDRRGATTGGAAVPNAKFTDLSFSEGGISTYYDDASCQFVVSGVPLARIAGQAACGRASVGQFDARRIDLGTGLQLVNNGDIAEISATHAVNGTNEKTGGAAFSLQQFETLNFEAGISVEAGSNCEVLISGIPRVRVDGLAACGRSAVTQAIYENISVGTGLSVTNQGDTALIVSEVKAEGTDKRGGGSSPVASQRYENLNFIGGISVHEGSGCELFVSGIQSAEVNVAGGAACGRGAVAQFQTDSFEFGTGLQVVNAGGTAFIDSTLSAQGTDKRGGGSSSVGPSLFENLNFIGNLSVHEGSNCEVFVSGISAGVSMSGLGQCGAPDYLKEDIGTIRIGSGLIAEAGGTIHSVFSAEGSTFVPREAYPCDEETAPFFKQNISGITFAGNISVEDGGCGNLIVSGIPTLYSGLAVCSRSAVPVFEGCTLGVGTGLQITNNDGRAILHSTMTFEQISAHSCLPAVSETAFETILASGFDASMNGCELQLNHIQNISKSVQGNCHFSGPGNSTFTPTPFKNLDFGTGLFVTVDGCNAVINAGFPAYEGTQCEPFSGTAGGITSVQGAIAGGYGITIDFDNSVGCNTVVISQNLGACSTNLIGQSMTKSADRPYEDLTCNVSACTDGTWNAGNGPFVERRPPKAWGDLIAGPGVGITAGCSGEAGGINGDCDVIFYANQIIGGINDSCEGKLVVQNYRTNYDCDFWIQKAQAAPPEQPDGADWTQVTNIKLSELAGCSWGGTVVTGIQLTKDGAYVTNVSPLTATLGGTKSCNEKYWLKTIPISWESNNCTPNCTNPL